MKIKKAFFKELGKSKYQYIFLITIIVLGILIGIILSNIISYQDKVSIEEVITNYFLHLQNGDKINYFQDFLNIFTKHSIYIFLILIFSFSIIGVFLNPFLLFFKSFITGFSMGVLISLYGYKGIIGAILYLIPHEFINFICYLLLAFYGIKLSIYLFKLLFQKKKLENRFFIKKYFKVLGITYVILLISSFLETFLSNFLMKCFTFIIR